MSQGIVVYAGKGSSHSWTWLADLFEANSIPQAHFVDEARFVRSLKGAPSTVIVSGGDAYAIASALSGEGFSELKRFIASGGIYVGVCAGAYLPLPTSVYPLSEFNTCSAKIENIVQTASSPDLASPRLGVPYCDKMIVHPARGEVALSFDGATVNAPVYGGPVFREPSEGRVIGRFCSFTGSTEIQIDHGDARDMVLGKPAVIEASYCGGRLLLLSPHLEHPGYPEANRLFMDLLELRGDKVERTAISQSHGGSRQSILLRAVADLSVALRGLEGRSFIVGGKMWDIERLTVLAEAIRKRAHSIPSGSVVQISARVRAARESVMGCCLDEPGAMDAVLDSLSGAARDCVNLGFEQDTACR